MIEEIVGLCLERVSADGDDRVRKLRVLITIIQFIQETGNAHALKKRRDRRLFRFVNRRGDDFEMAPGGSVTLRPDRSSNPRRVPLVSPPVSADKARPQTNKRRSNPRPWA